MTDVETQSKDEQNFCFTWCDYENHLSGVVQQLLNDGCMVDVTLSVAGERIHAHRMVLCACSTLFQEILSETPEDHPTIIISDISPQDMKSIVEFSYRGEVRIPVENINSLLEAAHLLKICGLMEIESLDDDVSNECKEVTVDSVGDSNESDNAWKPAERDPNTDETYSLSEPSHKKISKKRKRRRDYTRKEYNNDMLEMALSDVRAGLSLVDASTKNNVPRSTLYMRAKALGLQLNTTRHEYPAECLQAAINAVMSGSSFQHASELYSIPKTVLWRRIQKENYQSLRSETKRSYDSDKREAAIKALQRGENLTKVSLEFQIPKTTLFRDKVKLVDQGKLPETFWKRRKTEDEKVKQMRLEQAVAACMEGKMSQAAAAIAYHIPKTTIWRRLQQENKKIDRTKNPKRQSQLIQSIVKEEIEQKNDSDTTLCEVSSEIPLTYIDENNVPENSVIILTKGEVDELNLGDDQQIIDSDHEYVPCTISIEDSTNYATTDS
ncbi:uncharacterized protein [Chelonus insularis]|uniref:uncharacterized protein isoform X2 n=1 Tax=Chelonus insularis TaxID=460826 RepID=UPI00158BB6D4|nr:uncharacterized protein LOC118074243 isoform X2 [Chelonus insularis]